MSLLCFLLGCSKTESIKEGVELVSIIGTWQMIELQGKQVDKPFYIRYYDTGIAASWPAPKGWAAPNGVSYGTYSIDEQQLIVHRNPDIGDISVPYTLTESQLVFGNDMSKRSVYTRVTPDIEPVVDPSKPNQ